MIFRECTKVPRPGAVILTTCPGATKYVGILKSCGCANLIAPFLACCICARCCLSMLQKGHVNVTLPTSYVHNF